VSDEVRFQRMEDKIDSVKEEISEVKVEVTEIKADIKYHIDRVEDHITGDKKIINEIQPILAKMPHIIEMAEEYHLSKKMKAKVWRAVGGVGMLVGIAAGLAKIGIISF
jgi:wobble nucleotide-excising tRNase